MSLQSFMFISFFSFYFYFMSNTVVILIVLLNFNESLLSKMSSHRWEDHVHQKTNSRL